jgi:hypothetical protein
LVLDGELGMPVYKERAFTLSANLLNSADSPAPLTEPCTFKIQLYTTEAPPKAMKVNTSGAKIMRGTTVVQLSRGQFHLTFPKIVIKEVTSHFRNGCFFLVVMPSLPYVMPLIVENLVIKARKMCKEPRPRKKAKLELASGEAGSV